MTRLHSKRAMDYTAKHGELVRDEFFSRVNYNDIAEQWNKQFENLLENKSRVKNCALHLVVFLEPIFQMFLIFSNERFEKFFRLVHILD